MSKVVSFLPHLNKKAQEQYKTAYKKFLNNEITCGELDEISTQYSSNEGLEAHLSEQGRIALDNFIDQIQPLYKPADAKSFPLYLQRLIDEEFNLISNQYFEGTLSQEEYDSLKTANEYKIFALFEKFPDLNEVRYQEPVPLPPIPQQEKFNGLIKQLNFLKAKETLALSTT